MLGHILVQACLSLAVGLIFGGVLLASDVNGIQSLLTSGDLTDAAIFLGSAAVTFFPIVMATWVGVIAWDRPD